MTNALYQAAIQELEQVLPPRVVSRTLKDGLRERNQTPDAVDVDDFDAILKGSVYRQLQVSMPPDQAKEAVGAILERLRAVAEGRTAEHEAAPGEDDVDEGHVDEAVRDEGADPSAVRRQEGELVGLRAALKPFNMYFEWPEVQKLRAQVQLLEDEHAHGKEAAGLVDEAHRQLEAVRQKLEDHLVIQARELAELEEAFERVQSVGGVKVRRLENLLGHVREAQEARQLAPAEVERARKLANDLRKLVESSVYAEGDGDGVDAVLPDPGQLSPEVSQRIEQLDREAEARDAQRLADDHANLLDHLPELATRLHELRAGLDEGRRLGQDLADLREMLAAASERQRTALREEFARIEEQTRQLPSEMDTSELLQALAVARGVLETTLPSIADTQYVRRLHRLALSKRDELARAEAEAEVQRIAGLADQRALLERSRMALERFGGAAPDAEANALREAIAALAAADREGSLAPELALAVRSAEERFEATVAEHADDARVRERAQLRALLARVETLPGLEALSARVGGVKRELVRLIEAADAGPVDDVQLTAVRSLVEALRRDAIDTCRARLEQLAERASEIDAEELLGRIQSANNVLEDDVYPDVRQLESELRQQRDAFREAQFGELRRLERDAAEYLETSLDEAERLSGFVARAREQLESGGVAVDLRHGWELLDSVKRTVERRLADFVPRLDAALVAFQGVAMLNSEDVAAARRTLKHLDSQREAFPRVSTGLRIQLEQALDEAESLLVKLQEEVEATRAIADQLMSGGVLDDVLGLFGARDGSLEAGAAFPVAVQPTAEATTPADWLASFTTEPGVRAGAILEGAGYSEGTLPLQPSEVLERLRPLDAAVDRLGAELSRGPARSATVELDGRVLLVAWLEGERRLLLLLDSPHVLSLVGHRVRTELDDLQKRLRGSANA